MHYYLFALMAGAASTLQAGINGKLQASLGTPLLTSLISFVVGSFGLAISYLIAATYQLQSVPTLNTFMQTNSWMWCGGLLGAFFIFSTIFCSPKIGFANLFSLIVTGQVILSVIFDHYGFLGSPLHLLTPYRLIGTLLLIVSVYLIQTN